MKHINGKLIFYGLIFTGFQLMIYQNIVFANTECNENEYICIQNSPWYEGKIISLNVDSDDLKFKTYFSYTFTNSYDYEVTIHERMDKNKDHEGKILVLFGRIMLAKDLKSKKGYELDKLDFALHMYQLAATFLDLSFNRGPKNFSMKHFSSELNENCKRIKTSTPSVFTNYYAPWRLKADLERIGDDFKFSFYFSYMNINRPNELTTLQLNGNWERPQKYNDFSDETSIEGWEMYKLGTSLSPKENEMLNKSFKTLGELRKFIKDKQILD